MIASLHEKVSKSAWPSKYMAVLKNNMENADAPGGFFCSRRDSADQFDSSDQSVSALSDSDVAVTFEVTRGQLHEVKRVDVR